MMAAEGTAATAAAAAVIEALNDRDAARLGPLLSSEVEIATAKGVRVGRDPAIEWSLADYDHLLRRFLLDEAVAVGEGLLGRARSQYVWKEGGEVADTSPLYLSFEFEGALLARLGLHESEGAARAMLAGDGPDE